MCSSIWPVISLGTHLWRSRTSRSRSGRRSLPQEVDVLIVGCGPAGLVLAAQMARFPDLKTVVIDRRDGPLEVGQADGVSCRSVEMFETFGLATRLLDEAYWVNEVCVLATGSR